MKVVCLDNTRGNTKYLEVNKVYNTVKPTNKHKGYGSVFADHYVIDLNQYIKMHTGDVVHIGELWIKKSHMITVDEWRDNKLNQIL